MVIFLSEEILFLVCRLPLLCSLSPQNPDHDGDVVASWSRFGLPAVKLGASLMSDDSGGGGGGGKGKGRAGDL